MLWGFAQCLFSTIGVSLKQLKVTETHQNNMKNFSPMCSFALTKYYRLGSLNNRNFFFFHNSRGWKSRMKVLACQISSQSFILGLQVFTFLLFLHMAFLYAHTSLVSLLLLLIRIPVLLHQGPTLTLMISFNLSCLFKALSKQANGGGVRASTRIWGGPHNSVHIIP